MRKQIAAANWKMNLTLQQAENLLDEILKTNEPGSVNREVVFAVPFPYLLPAKQKIHGKKNFFIAGQNCYTKKAGAFTGETSAEMLRSVGTDYVVLGHSERREYFNESNSMLAEKIDMALSNALVPIFCCGEPLKIREAGTQNQYVQTQLQESIFHLEPGAIQKIVIAYEPIWAIGTGKTATAEQAQDMHAYIRSVIKGKYGDEVAENISILYGGSVKGANARELFSQRDVDGGLVGGASLSAAEFTQIIQALK
jgi:triosephosphate isomerase (TIM)